MDENDLESVDAVIDNVQGIRDENINISDVIEVIETDLDFKQSPKMFNGGGEIPQPQQPMSIQEIRKRAYVRIVEEPASKALRFRYECEGRSAGSIPGASSTPENKTFPSIQIVGYTGRAVVVVSCVTKDPPYRPHPHNLVGREGCKKGVCTLEISPETMSVTFSNLGIQCIKKKDIEAALKVREEIRVDPFRTGFSHRNQPTSIDLNAVRLCFQVFLESERGKFTVPLTPVVSQPIYDKKAMSDLVIVKLSDCVSYVDGGRKDMILLCEKVAKEDIQIRFFEKKDGQIVWEGFGDFQPSQVHKQTAIWFRTPKYRTLDVTEPVKVFIQLRRPSDGVESEPLPFELLPLDSGRPPYWSFRRNLAKKGNYSLFDSILANDAKLLAKRQLGKAHTEVASNQKTADYGAMPNTTVTTTTVISDSPAVAALKTDVQETNNNVIIQNRPAGWSLDYAEVKKTEKLESPEIVPSPQCNQLAEKSYNQLINQIRELEDYGGGITISSNNKNGDKVLDDILVNQVAELDQIYEDTKAKLLTESPPENGDLPHNDSFDDTKTYTSLQLAFKNPLDIEMKETYEDVIINPQSPLIDVVSTNNNKRENDSEKLPPLPPKRAKKKETFIGSMESIDLTDKQSEKTLLGSNLSLKASTVNRSHSFSLPRPKSQSDLPPEKGLPPTPCSTLPNPKKRNFFSKLFGRKSKSVSRETSVTPTPKPSSLSGSSNALQTGTNLARSSSNISTHSSSSIRIPLKDSSSPSAPPLTNIDANQVVMNVDMKDIILNPSGDDLVMNLDLTEAEHYALYTAMAPHATQSEFDEFSCYYAPVEGGKILTSADVISRLASKT